MSSVSNFQGRRVVTGQTNRNRSTIISDEMSATRVVTPTFTAVDIWQTDSAPPSVDAENTLADEVIIQPPMGVLVVRLASFPPDSEWEKLDDAYGDAMAAVSGAEAEDDGIPGLHVTDTVDVVTVIEGEIWAVLQEHEVLLKEGDSLVQRGTKHAWSNRTDRPATFVVALIGARR
jgi:mannose-6-phosphate isomerase-like protein (cupin superfamily)